MDKPKKARLGLIGAGWWATSNHLPIFMRRNDVELAGVCRLGRAELKLVQESFGFQYATEDYQDLLDRCELDGVVVASPHTLHYEHARAALEKGLHVMCEKPFTIRASHARELVQLAQARDVHLLVPYGWHYKPFVQQARQLMAGNPLGEIEYVLCHMASPMRKVFEGKGMDMEDFGGQAAGTMFLPDPATWADPQLAGGGYGHAQMSHASGMLFWLTGLRAQSVYCLMTAPGAKVDLYNAISVQFSGGAIGTFSGAGTIPTDRPYQVDLRIFGTEGMLLLDCERARLELRRHHGDHVVADVAPGAGAYECDGPPNNFVDLILGKTGVNWAPGEAAMRSVELLDAAYRSALSGVAEMV